MNKEMHLLTGDALQDIGFRVRAYTGDKQPAELQFMIDENFADEKVLGGQTLEPLSERA